MADEKRSAHRIHVRLRASFRSSHSVIEGWVSDISRLGLFLRAEHLDDEGARGTIDLEIPKQAPLRLSGQVVRVVNANGHSGMGIRFDHVPEEARRPLANFMIESSFQSVR